MTDSAPLLSTPLFAWHREHDARIVGFGGWNMPLLYKSIASEHQAVRERAGLFDIGHMGRLRIEGPGAVSWIDRCTTNDVANLAEGRAHYSFLTLEDGGIVDDLLVYKAASHLRLVCNASNRSAVVTHLLEHRGSLEAELTDLTESTAMFALQGPRSAEILRAVLGSGPVDNLRNYHFTDLHFASWGDAPAWVSRTGYTGEDGYEMVVRSDQADLVWTSLLEVGTDYLLEPCGLGARDTLRLEAAMPLYGHELDRTIDPFEAGFGWAVKLDHGPFLGRAELQTRSMRPRRCRIGLELNGSRIPRQGMHVLESGQAIGHITSGTQSPTLGTPIALALVTLSPDGPPSIGSNLQVEIRGHQVDARVVSLPFYRRPRA